MSGTEFLSDPTLSSIPLFFVYKRGTTKSEWDRFPVCIPHTLWVGVQGRKS